MNFKIYQNMVPKNKFTPEIIKMLNYYVYRLIDPRNGETFYIGKGKGNRIFTHVNGSLKYKKDEDEISTKIKTIREINAAGLAVIHVIHRHNLDESTALEVEAALIDAYPSATNIVGGRGNDFGIMNTKQIMDRYSAQVADFGKDKVIMITINKSFPERSLYDATRLAWRVDIHKANEAKYVLSVQNGLIIGVFVDNKWKKATKENFEFLAEDIPGRAGFDGKEEHGQVAQRFLNKRKPDEYIRKKGAANPIQYNY